MVERPPTPTDPAGALLAVARRAGSEMELQIEAEKLLDPFLPALEGYDGAGRSARRR